MITYYEKQLFRRKFNLKSNMNYQSESNKMINFKEIGMGAKS